MNYLILYTVYKHRRYKNSECKEYYDRHRHHGYTVIA